MRATALLNKSMLAAILGDEHDCPQHFFICPQPPKGGFKRRMNPKSWFCTTVMVFIVCPQGLCIVPCGPDGKGYKMTMPKGWVKDWAAGLGACLVLLKSAAFAGKLVGVPFLYIPTIPGLSKISHAMAGAADVAKQQLEGLDEMMLALQEEAGDEGMPAELVSSFDAMARGETPPPPSAATSAVVGASFRAMRAFVLSADPSLQHVGVEKVVAGGAVAWVAPQNKAAWMRQQEAGAAAEAAAAQAEVEALEAEAMGHIVDDEEEAIAVD